MTKNDCGDIIETTIGRKDIPMNYVVVDLEWNQAMSSKSSVFNKLPIHLRGEIIEIGAVRLNDDMSLGEEFTVDVKPIYFRRMHGTVKKLTGFSTERLANGLPFRDAFEKFRDFCGNNPIFLTWGCDDRGIMEQNIIIHDLEWDWIKDWVNLQTIFNLQTNGEKNQRSLASAMEYYGIEQTRIAHDALGDAYNTALVCTHLDMKSGLKLYPDADKYLHQTAKSDKSENNDQGQYQEPVYVKTLSGFNSKAEAFSDDEIKATFCPECNRPMIASKWVNQGDQRYMNVFECPEHGQYLSRIRFKKNNDENIFTATKLVYKSDDNMLSIYKSKLIQARRRGRSHSSKLARQVYKD